VSLINFINHCIIDKFCTDECKYKTICNKEIKYNECNVFKFLNWIDDNNMNICNMLKIENKCYDDFYKKGE